MSGHLAASRSLDLSAESILQVHPSFDRGTLLACPLSADACCASAGSSRMPSKYPDTSQCSSCTGVCHTMVRAITLSSRDPTPLSAECYAHTQMFVCSCRFIDCCVVCAGTTKGMRLQSISVLSLHMFLQCGYSYAGMRQLLLSQWLVSRI